MYSIILGNIVNKQLFGASRTSYFALELEVGDAVLGAEGPPNAWSSILKERSVASYTRALQDVNVRSVASAPSPRPSD